MNVTLLKFAATCSYPVSATKHRFYQYCFGCLLALLLGLSTRGAARADSIFVVNDGSQTIGASSVIGEYTTSGAPVNAALISGLDSPSGMVASGALLFVANHYSGTIGKYTISGETIDPALISGLSDPIGIAVSGSDLFVANFVSGTIGKYTISGETINPALISGLYGARSIAVSGSDLFVLHFGTI